jgi:hypothetical protein
MRKGCGDIPLEGNTMASYRAITVSLSALTEPHFRLMAKSVALRSSRMPEPADVSA